MVWHLLIDLLWVLLAYTSVVAFGFLWKPEKPWCLLGYVQGPVRMEDGTGKEWYSESNRFFFWFQGERDHDGEMYAVSHIQYRSRFWILWMFPMIFHFSIQPRFQDMKPNPNVDEEPDQPALRLPGTELCTPYARLWGWRWSKEGYVASKGYFGFHLD